MSILKDYLNKRKEKMEAYRKYAHPIYEKELKEKEAYYKAKEKEAELKSRIRSMKYKKTKQTGNKLRNFAQNLKKTIDSNRGEKRKDIFGSSPGLDYGSARNPFASEKPKRKKKTKEVVIKISR